MAVPASIANEITVLGLAIDDATPLASASVGVLTALATTADEVADAVQDALVAATGALDMWSAPYMAPAIALGVLGVLNDSLTQLSLADLRGVTGRIASNLTNGVP